MSAQACVVCHRPDDPATPEDEEPSYMQLFSVVHGIHNSHEFPGDGFVTDRDNLYNVTYPTYMSNCSVCHSADTIVPATGGSALAAANAMPVTGQGLLHLPRLDGEWRSGTSRPMQVPPDATFRTRTRLRLRRAAILLAARA